MCITKSANNPSLDSCVCSSLHNLLFRYPFILVSVSDGHVYGTHSTPLLRETRGACKPNLQVAITRARHVCSQDSFVFVFHRRMNVMHKRNLTMRVENVYHLYLITNVLIFHHVKLTQNTALSLERLNLRPISHELPKVWLLLALVIN